MDQRKRKANEKENAKKKETKKKCKLVAFEKHTQTHNGSGDINQLLNGIHDSHLYSSMPKTSQTHSLTHSDRFHFVICSFFISIFVCFFLSLHWKCVCECGYGVSVAKCVCVCFLFVFFTFLMSTWTYQFRCVKGIYCTILCIARTVVGCRLFEFSGNV